MQQELFADLPEHEPRPPERPLALGGIRVVDFSHYLAGPLATVVLADLGADVIKVEAPAGDDFRQVPPHHPDLQAQGAPFLWSNRNKRSIALDLKLPEGRAIARDLIRDADVLVENFSTGVMERLGLDYASCAALNRRLIYCSVSAYGREGPFSDRAGFDPIVQAESGFISMNGYPDRDGVRTVAMVMDVGTALMASNAVLGALFARTATGRGQRLEVALFDCAMTMVGYTSMQSLFGTEHVRVGNISPDSSPTGVFHAQDKSFYLACGNDRKFNAFCLHVIERPDLAEEPELKTRAGRIAQRPRLNAILDETFATRPWSYWQDRLRAQQIPHGEVRSMPEALASQEVRERRLLSRIPHGRIGWIPNVALPIRMSDTPLADPRPAPAIGEHSMEVLTDVLGYSLERASALREAGVVAEGMRSVNGKKAGH